MNNLVNPTLAQLECTLRLFTRIVRKSAQAAVKMPSATAWVEVDARCNLLERVVDLTVRYQRGGSAPEPVPTAHDCTPSADLADLRDAAESPLESAQPAPVNAEEATLPIAELEAQAEEAISPIAELEVAPPPQASTPQALVATDSSPALPVPTLDPPAAQVAPVARPERPIPSFLPVPIPNARLLKPGQTMVHARHPYGHSKFCKCEPCQVFRAGHGVQRPEHVHPHYRELYAAAQRVLAEAREAARASA